MDTHILVVDDDPAHARVLAFLLDDHGYTTASLNDPRTILNVLREQPVSLVLLGTDLPYHDGFSLCAQLKRQDSNRPVILLSGRRTPADEVRGFEQGADDYIIRPYAPSVLLARVQAVLRRYRATERNAYGNAIRVGDTSLDMGTLTFTTSSQTPAVLTPTEARILEHLMRSAGAVVTREALIARVWGYDSESADNRVDVYIRRIRQKIGATPDDQRLIRTMRGVGFVYEDDRGAARRPSPGA